MADCDIPVAAAMDRVDRCVSWPGPRSCSVLVITSFTCCPRLERRPRAGRGAETHKPPQPLFPEGRTTRSLKVLAPAGAAAC